MQHLERLPAYRQPNRTYDRIGRQVPVRLDAVPLLHGLPGLAAQWRKVVPLEYMRPSRVRSDVEVLERDVIVCVCTAAGVPERPWSMCPGGCGRFFMLTERGARCAGPYPPCPDATRT